MIRTHTCGELTKTNESEIVELSGWVNKRRDFGNIIDLPYSISLIS